MDSKSFHSLAWEDTGMGGRGDVNNMDRQKHGTGQSSDLHCAWSLDGRWIAAGPQDDGATYIWETSTFQRQHSHTAWKGGLLAVSPNGRWVATAVRPRSLATGRNSERKLATAGSGTLILGSCIRHLLVTLTASVRLRSTRKLPASSPGPAILQSVSGM